MDSFTPLERTALDAILTETDDHRAAVECQLLSATVGSRENTGGGFFVHLHVPDEVELLDMKTAPLGNDVWIAIDGMEYGLGAILHFKHGRVRLLEGYAVGPEDTSSIDFGHVSFAIIKVPGRFPNHSC
ncbi:hypothetical protein [Parasphingorhabdus sp.]|uniref:hypothetical protein n=1 Tax=Parasphingorhabdus sp. TaxID=2709688 RepID=UPI003A921152